MITWNGVTVKQTVGNLGGDALQACSCQEIRPGSGTYLTSWVWSPIFLKPNSRSNQIACNGSLSTIQENSAWMLIKMGSTMSATNEQVLSTMSGNWTWKFKMSSSVCTFYCEKKRFTMYQVDDCNFGHVAAFRQSPHQMTSDKPGPSCLVSKYTYLRTRNKNVHRIYFNIHGNQSSVRAASLLYLCPTRQSISK